jgi:hypothetical protein
MVAGAPLSHVSAASAALSMQLRRMQLLFTGNTGVVWECVVQGAGNVGNLMSVLEACGCQQNLSLP